MKKLLYISCACIGVSIESLFVGETKRGISFLVLSLCFLIAYNLKNNNNENT